MKLLTLVLNFSFILLTSLAFPVAFGEGLLTQYFNPVKRSSALSDLSFKPSLEILISTIIVFNSQHLQPILLHHRLSSPHVSSITEESSANLAAISCQPSNEDVIMLRPLCLLPSVPSLLTQESFLCRVGFPQRPCHFSIQAPSIR